MTTYNVKEYKGGEDLARMQRLVSINFTKYSDFHIGDIAWQRFQHDRVDDDWSIYLVEDQGELVAWGWIDPYSSLVLVVHPSHFQVTEILLDRFIESGCKKMVIDIFESESHIISGLLSYGFKERRSGPFYFRLYRDLENLPEIELPEGYKANHIDRNSDLEKRVEVHREAWEPSKVTYKSYEKVVKTPPYNEKLDWVTIAPDNTFASYCLIWHDKISKIGLLEPVGTSPRFRRLGLSRAVCTLALKELRELGGKGAIVNARGDEERPIPLNLYRSMGFREISKTRSFAWD